MSNTLKTGAAIWDGSGERPSIGDVLIEGNRIAALWTTTAKVGQMGAARLAD